MLALLGFWGLTWVKQRLYSWVVFVRLGFVRCGPSAMGAGCSSCCARNRSQPAPTALEPSGVGAEAFSLCLEPFFGQVQGDLPAYGGVKG